MAEYRCSFCVFLFLHLFMSRFLMLHLRPCVCCYSLMCWFHLISWCLWVPRSEKGDGLGQTFAKWGWKTTFLAEFLARTGWCDMAWFLNGPSMWYADQLCRPKRYPKILWSSFSANFRDWGCSNFETQTDPKWVILELVPCSRHWWLKEVQDMLSAPRKTRKRPEGAESTNAKMKCWIV